MELISKGLFTVRAELIALLAQGVAALDTPTRQQNQFSSEANDSYEVGNDSFNKE